MSTQHAKDSAALGLYNQVEEKATVQFHLDNLLVTGTFAASARWATLRRYFDVVI